MNREIKFRAWNEKLKCMSKVLELDFQHDAIRCIPGHLPKNRLSDCVLMIYTGLKDNNGKEIYEGDIVKYNADYENPEDWGTVVWSEGGFASFALKMKKSSSFLLGKRFGSEYEIIGNIYENPELLK